MPNQLHADSIRVSLVMPRGLLKRIKSLAVEENRSVSNCVVTTLPHAFPPPDGEVDIIDEPRKPAEFREVHPPRVKTRRRTNQEHDSPKRV